jgi:broad-specificity NMP kinase
MTIIVLTATPGCGKTNHAVWSAILSQRWKRGVLFMFAAFRI